MNESPASNPTNKGCPTYDTLRAFAHCQLAADVVLHVIDHLYMQRCPRCSELLLAMPETTGSVFGPATPSLPMDPDRPTEDARPATSGARPQHNGYQPLRLGRYTIRGQVGKGGFGTVYAAYDEELDRLVAVKVPYAHRLSVGEQEQASAEARLHASLDHPNIVPIYDVGRTDEIPCYFVSKLIVGQDLAARIREERLGFRESAEMLLLVAGALEHMHKRGLVHRDVKPRNILLDQAGKPYLADFGLAMHPLPAGDDGAEDNLIAGTLAYMSPEQARGENKRLDQRTDLYALGVVLYEMLTGQKPFRGSIVAVRNKILNETPASPRSLEAGVPDDLEAICLKAMVKDTDSRYQDAGQLAEDLRCYLAGEPLLHARHVGPYERAWSWLRRHRALSVVASVAGAALMLVVFLALQKSPTPSPGLPAEKKTVRATVQTEPAGASVSYFPLDGKSGQPLPEKATREKAGEPVELTGGYYLVVAVLSGKGGEPARFHEVFRLVPGGEGGMSGPFRHQRWAYLDGVIHLEKIVLPPADITEGMCLFPEGKDFVTPWGEPRLGEDRKLMFPERRVHVPAFYLDTTEVPTGVYHRWLLGEKAAGHKPMTRPADHAAASVTWGHAAAYAEWRGKRLPDEAEYEFAATAGGKRRYPWGDSAEPLERTKWSFGPVGKPEHDRVELPGQPLVFGLYSNVAEWTSSWPGDHPGREPGFLPSLLRVVRGGTMAVVEGKEPLPRTLAGPRERFGLRIVEEKPGLGFRCARSARPRLEAKDFVALAP